MSIGQRYTDERYDAAIDDMASLGRYVQDFLIDGADVDKLIGLFLSRGIPLHDRSSRDDSLIDQYDDQATQLRDAFTKFVHERPLGSPLSRIDAYIDFCDAHHQEDAA